MAVYIGVDPGLTGALALLCGDRVVTYALPVRDDVTTGRRVIDVPALHRLVTTLASLGPELWAVERVGGIRGQSASASFSFGSGYGRLLAVIELTGQPLVTVPPLTWRAAVGVYGESRRRAAAERDTPIAGRSPGRATKQASRATKQASRAIANALWPADAHQWARATRDGHAEAALIASYGRMSQAE